MRTIQILMPEELVKGIKIIQPYHSSSGRVEARIWVITKGLNARVLANTNRYSYFDVSETVCAILLSSGLIRQVYKHIST